MEATGGELIEIPPAVCEKVAAQYEKHDSGRGSADWPAYLRMLDRTDAGGVDAGWGIPSTSAGRPGNRIAQQPAPAVIQEVSFGPEGVSQQLHRIETTLATQNPQPDLARIQSGIRDVRAKLDDGVPMKFNLFGKRKK